MVKKLKNLLANVRKIDSSKIILTVCLLVLIFSFVSWSYLSDYGIKNVYYIGQSIAWFLASIFFFITNKKWIVSKIFVLYSINNLLDELFFDPTVLSHNKTVFAIVAIILLYCNSKNQK